MTARLVLVCDVCGAVTDDHYAHPVADARFRARATGWTRRRHIRKNGDRLFADLCPEHTYGLGFLTEPIAGKWKRVRPNQPEDPQPLTPGIVADDNFGQVTVTYQDGSGPYRLYTSLVEALRAAGAGRGTLERVRREMFAPGADFLVTAGRWATVETEETDVKVQTEEGATGEPRG